MSDRFNDLLSGVVDSAASAAREPGAEAARKRGRQRRNHQRLAASTLSLALLGVVGGVAAVTMNGSTGVPTAHASGTATPAVTDSPSPMPSMSSSPSATASGIPGTGTPSATSPSTAVTSSAAVVVSESWLTAGQVPFDSTMNWVGGSVEHCTGQLSFNSAYMSGCVQLADPGMGHAATKMDDVTFASRGVPIGNGAWEPPMASQQFYTYASVAQAQSAFTYITQQIRDEDAAYDQSYDTTTNLQTVSTTTVTAQFTGAMAIDAKLRDTQGNPTELDGNPSPASDRHYFFAVKGNVLEVVAIRGGPSVSDTSNDTAILQTVADALNQPK